MYPVCVNGILTYIELVGTEKQPPVHVGYIWAVALGCAMLTKALTETITSPSTTCCMANSNRIASSYLPQIASFICNFSSTEKCWADCQFDAD